MELSVDTPIAGLNPPALAPVRARPGDTLDVMRRARPVVFDCPSPWRLTRPMLATLQSEYGHLRCEDMGGSYGWAIRYSARHAFRSLGIRTLGQYIELFRRGDRRLPYLRHISVHRDLPAMRRHFVPPPQFRPNWVEGPAWDRLGGPELFIGQAGTGFGPLHIDHASVHVGFYQFQGEKRFLLIPPEDGRYLYRTRGAQFPYQLRNSPISGFDAEAADRYPMLRQARATTVVLRAGQGRFLPANWWHTTLNQSDSVSYSIRIVNRTNAARTLGDYALGAPRAVLAKLGR